MLAQYEGFGRRMRHGSEGAHGRRAGEPIGREKLRAAARRLGAEYICYMLDRAIDLLPPRGLALRDEGDLCELGIDWATVLRAYFRCLSRTAEADEYARRVVEVLSEFGGYDHEKYLSLALRLGTSAQQRELRGALRQGAATRS